MSPSLAAILPKLLRRSSNLAHAIHEPEWNLFTLMAVRYKSLTRAI